MSALEASVEPEAPRPSDRAHYLAALAVGLAEAGLTDATAVAQLAGAAEARPGDLVAARRRLYSTTLGSCASRRDATRLLDLARQQLHTPRLRPFG